MATEVRVRKDGIVLHRHPSTNCQDPEGRWHGPWETHSRAYGQRPVDPEAHIREGAGRPKGLENLTREQRIQYARSLAHSSPGVAGSAYGQDPTRTAEYLALHPRKGTEAAPEVKLPEGVEVDVAGVLVTA